MEEVLPDYLARGLNGKGESGPEDSTTLAWCSQCLRGTHIPNSRVNRSKWTPRVS
jgi:hypothetical protein